jgi:hypothetical protein
MLNKLAKALGCVLTVLNMGCYSYQPSPADAVAPGTSARVHLAEPQEISLAATTVRSVIRVDGSVVETGDGTAVLSSTSLLTQSGLTEATRGEMVRIPEGNIQVFETSQVNAGKTAAFLVVAGGAIAAALLAIASSGNKGDSGDGGGNEGGSGTGGFRIPLGGVGWGR